MRPQGSEVGDYAHLVIGGAAAVKAAIELDRLEGVAAPPVGLERRLDVVVRVEQHRRCAGWRWHLGSDRRWRVGYLEQSHAFEAGGLQRRGDVVGGFEDRRRVWSLGTDGADADQFLQLAPRGRL